MKTTSRLREKYTSSGISGTGAPNHRKHGFVKIPGTPCVFHMDPLPERPGRNLMAWEAMERDHTPFPEPLMRETMAHIQTPVLREAVARRQDFYTRQLQTPFDYQGSLKATTSWPDWRRERNPATHPRPYRGKVVYADIWADGAAHARGTCVISSLPSKKP